MVRVGPTKYLQHAFGAFQLKPRLMVLSQRLATKWRTLNAHSISSVKHGIIFCCLRSSRHGAFGLHTAASNETVIPFRKQQKEEAKARRATAKLGAKGHGSEDRSHADRWELTVGLEVHAQLNTERKLFSNSLTSVVDKPNCHIALFDLAVPGSQPVFQHATLLPALRAAVALDCDIQRRSKFDRKHYFYQDQPAGYQLTQYYEPFAKDGHVTLFDYDGIAAEDYPSVRIGIKQIQMEQDTAKTIQQPPDVMLLDFNRVGHPLIEIITLPNIHHAKTAAACVRKIQSILQAVNAVTTGMEMGGLRADVNVSVRPRGVQTGPHTYYGVTELGQRTEIKNLSSFKAVEDAINAERDRQVRVLEQGGSIEGETRGWTIGGKETEKLRGKEGEVDYRYMPDPDIAPVVIDKDVISYISASLPMLPDKAMRQLVDKYDLSTKDARTLVSLDAGNRLDYFYKVVSQLVNEDEDETEPERRAAFGRVAANWTLHELGGILSAAGRPFSMNAVPADALACIIKNLLSKKITGRTAKQLLLMVFNGEKRAVDDVIEEDGLKFQTLAASEYQALAEGILAEHPDVVEKIQAKRQVGKVQFFVGQMVRKGEGKVEAEEAESVLRRLLELDT